MWTFVILLAILAASLTAIALKPRSLVYQPVFNMMVPADKFECLDCQTVWHRPEIGVPIPTCLCGKTLNGPL